VGRLVVVEVWKEVVVRDAGLALVMAWEPGEEVRLVLGYEAACLLAQEFP